MKNEFFITYRNEVKSSIKYKVILRNKDKYSISEMCRFFNVSYSYLNRKKYT